MTSAISSTGCSYQSYAPRSSGTGADPSKMIQDLFSKIDSNGDGSIDKSELTSFLQDAQSSTKSGTQSVDVQSALSALDTDGDGAVTKQEFTDSANSLFGKLREQMTSHGAHHHHAAPPPQASDSDSDTSSDSSSASNNSSNGTSTNSANTQSDDRAVRMFLAALGQYQSTQTDSSTTASQLSVAA